MTSEAESNRQSGAGWRRVTNALVQRIAVRLFGKLPYQSYDRAPLSRWAQQSRPPAAYAMKY